MPRRSTPQHDLAWPPPDDDLSVMDLARSADSRPPQERQPGPVSVARRSGRAVAVPARPRDEPDRAPGPVVLVDPLQAITRRVPPRALFAALGICVLAAVAMFAGRGLLGRDAGAPGLPAAATASAASTPPAAAAVGSLAVSTQPPGALVFVDGRRLGPSPVTVDRIEAGEHLVVIQPRDRTVRHTAQVGAGQAVSVVVPIPDAPAPAQPPAPAAAAGGFITVRAPFEVRVTREGRLLGTSEMARIPMAPGTHTLFLVDEATGYQAARTVSVRAGRTTPVEVQLPEERVAINAIPWAEVLVDGRPVGETPLGALRLSIGPHVITLRHPRLGEKSVTTTVKVGAPARISVDMRQ